MSCQTHPVPKGRFVCKGGAPNFKISRFSTLNPHNFINFYSIHKLFMGGIDQMYIYAGVRGFARAHHVRAKILNRMFLSKIFERLTWPPLDFREF